MVGKHNVETVVVVRERFSIEQDYVAVKAESRMFLGGRNQTFERYVQTRNPAALPRKNTELAPSIATEHKN